MNSAAVALKAAGSGALDALPKATTIELVDNKLLADDTGKTQRTPEEVES